ncbi:MAG: PIN domain-containing protein [Gammaproteobacteria bacterium]|nr:PIN domain-containing protein [Gammaproteobacteria bacterium]
MTIYLDTHVLVWLLSGENKLLSKKAVHLIENNELITGSINLLELEYLYEIKRIPMRALEVYNELQVAVDLKLHDLGDKAMMKSIDIAWTRDPFDRITVAGSAILNIPLLTKDKHILEHFPLAVW